MKSIASAASAALIWGIGAAAANPTAAVHLYNPSSSPVQTSTRSPLSPVAARCVLAQRANVLQYHTASLDGGLDDETVSAINSYGVHAPLAASEDYKRATILLEGVEDIESIPTMSQTPSFLIDPIPSFSDARDLLVNLARQSGRSILDGMSQADAIRALAASSEKTSSGDIYYLAQSVEEFSRIWERLVGEKTHITTIVVTADVNSEGYQWGQYQMPGAQALLHESGKRVVERRAAASDLAQRRQDSSYNGTLRGILPACFTSQSACETMTLNCTGHGACVKKYSDSSDFSSGSSSVKACYSCQCRSTSTTNSDGRKQTTYWGGPACQKRDVSSAFWLIVLFTVGMIFLVGFGIGQLWSMGEQELPSVIGAGVSGPVRRS